MDENLDLHYRFLFNSYEVTDRPVVQYAKVVIAERMRHGQPLLRSDAGYLLLVNLDHMVVRPLTETAVSPEGDELPGMFRPVDAEPIITALMRRLFAVLEEGELPASAHSVMSATQLLWGPIGEQLNWA